MSTRLPVVTGDQLLRAVMRAGWTKIRTKGSHVRLAKGDRFTTIAVHPARTIPPGTLKSILEDVSITADELRDLL
ncbi:MAG: type II toxin-antitoxin system HicA family toxin [Vulcanimicrobiaceae bacterium]